MLTLPDSWVWDFWLADDGQTYHLFFLFASRALADPDLRHHRASIGHAVSADLHEWTRVSDALVAGRAPAFDDLATWTGSIVRAPDDTWVMFYTGATLSPGGVVQAIGIATSPDLMTWRKYLGNPVVRADARWYETLPSSQWSDEAWRDPWIFADPDGDGWHMLITARGKDGARDDRGVLAHARSSDLYTWTVGPPVTTPGAGFQQIEVPQLSDIDGTPVLLFSCAPDEYAAARRNGDSPQAGTWALPVSALLGPYDLTDAQALTDPSLYSGRLIKDRAGRSVLLAFHHLQHNGFGGSISDPIGLSWCGDTIVRSGPAPSGTCCAQ
jgi:beta-fructofuranosidase